MNKKLAEYLSIYWPLILLVVVFLAIGIHGFMVGQKRAASIDYSAPTAYEEIKACNENPDCRIIWEGSKADYRTPKERCLDDARNMIQAWRCR